MARARHAMCRHTLSDTCPLVSPSSTHVRLQLVPFCLPDAQIAKYLHLDTQYGYHAALQVLNYWCRERAGLVSRNCPFSPHILDNCFWRVLISSIALPDQLAMPSISPKLAAHYH